ncbi:MAG: oxygenase MpaB family protein [Pseudolysinimonas sp.]
MTERSEAFRRYSADGFLVLGGLTALLLQLGDPAVARGVAAHSSFAQDPLRRLHGTLRYVYTVALGSERQRDRVARAVDGSHARVPGARDPDRQLWVAATLVRTGTDIHALLRRPLDPRLADEVHAAGADLATLLQLPPSAWPRDRAAFDAYWDATIATLDVGHDARAVATDLFAARHIPWWGRLAMPSVKILTAGMLPPAVREAYGLVHSPRRFRAVVRMLRVLARVTPRSLRELPSRRLLAKD